MNITTVNKNTGYISKDLRAYVKDGIIYVDTKDQELKLKKKVQ